jgi:hypothetical protein
VTPLIVVILAVAWIVVLVPPLLRSRSDGRPSTSIGSFRQQLATLSRTGPDRRGGVRSLNRPMAAPRRAAAPGHPGRLTAVPRPAGGYEDERAYGYDDRRAYGAPGGRRGQAPGYGGYPAARSPYARTGTGRYAAGGYPMRSARSEVRRRRLNVLVGLLAVAATTAIGGFGLGISALVAVNLVVDAVLVFYVYLLVQLRRAEEDRAMRGMWSQAA